MPSMSDESIIVENQGHIFLAGPPLVKAATGEVVSAEDLGGGQLHTSVSGVTDYLAVDDAHALVLARRSIGNLNWPKKEQAAGKWAEPLYDAEELGGIVGTNLRKPIPVHEIIARVVDGSEFAEFKRDYGSTLVTGKRSVSETLCSSSVPSLSRIPCSQHPRLRSDIRTASRHHCEQWHSILRVLAQGRSLYRALHPTKHSSCISPKHQVCPAYLLSLLEQPRLTSCSGFMVGRDAEKGGIAKNGAKLVTAVACAEVPKFTVVFGASAGAGNYGMW